MKRAITFLFLFVFLFSTTEALTENIYKKITVTKCDSLIKANENNPNFVILDVRTYGEWVNDHLAGSINRSTGNSNFEQQLDVLPKHKIFLIHCQSGGRSAGAFSKMQALNFSEVYEMQGGIGTWKSNGYPTTSELAPKLMLVSYTDVLENSSGTDTINITITNRANEILTFSSATFYDIHEIESNFNESIQLAGAEDYTFSVYHTPSYFELDTTRITLKSNGGELELNIVLKDGTIQNIESEFQNELVLYPNPAKDNLFVKSNFSENFDEVSIISLNGRTVLQENYFSTSSALNISHLQTGIYIVQIKTTDETILKKIIVSR
jgi:rhodanese-related sulfurtransferase